MPTPPRGILVPFPEFVPDLDRLPQGTLLEPGMQVRYRGGRWRIDAEAHCQDPDDPRYDMVALVDDQGRRHCLNCGALPPRDLSARGDDRKLRERDLLPRPPA